MAGIAGSLPGGCGGLRGLIVGARHDSNLRDQGGDGPQFRIDIGDEEPADSRRILTDRRASSAFERFASIRDSPQESV